MTLKVAIVQAAAASGTPTFNQDFTDPTTFGGATPKAAIFLASIATANNTATATINQAIGWVATTGQAAVSIEDNDASSPNAANSANFSTQAYAMVSSAASTTGDATGSLIADGARLVFRP